MKYYNKRHRALGRLLESAEYGIPHAVVFDDDMMSVSEKIFYAPVYMMMFLAKGVLPEKMIYEIGEPLQVQGSFSG